MKDFPKYRSRKTVNALKIKKVEKNLKNNGALLHFTKKEFEPIIANDQFMLKHKPEVGGFYLVEEDGYPLCVSSKQFSKDFEIVKKVKKEKKEVKEVKKKI